VPQNRQQKHSQQARKVQGATLEATSFSSGLNFAGLNFAFLFIQFFRIQKFLHKAKLFATVASLARKMMNRAIVNWRLESRKNPPTGKWALHAAQASQPAGSWDFPVPCFQILQIEINPNETITEKHAGT
jgi:hypothetical protein